MIILTRKKKKTRRRAKKGNDADIVILDKKFSVKNVFLKGNLLIDNFNFDKKRLID
jgi:adenine deaminase